MRLFVRVFIYQRDITEVVEYRGITLRLATELSDELGLLVITDTQGRVVYKIESNITRANEADGHKLTVTTTQTDYRRVRFDENGNEVA